jgi:L-threonylcarbamoyladenylate synthase
MSGGETNQSPAVLGSVPTGTDVNHAARCLRQGLLVAMPTETVYGLAGAALQPRAAAAIFEAKQRPHFDPLIVHVAELDQVSVIAETMPPAGRALAERFWPGPLTLILPRRSEVPDLITAGLPGVGVRIPAHPVARQLIRQAGIPVAAPSANPFGGISPTTAAHVIAGLGQNVDYVLDGGSCTIGVESTIISVMGETPVLLRPGGLALEEIENLIGRIEIAKPDPAEDDRAQIAPGMLSRHYAPRSRMSLIGPDEPAVPQPGLRTVLLTWGCMTEAPGFERILSLGPADDLQICAARFFAALRVLDSLAPDVIIARQFPERGLGRALNDRLRRGATTPETSG